MSHAFLTNILRKFSSGPTSPVRDVLVIGSGLMGGGIAQVAAAAGMKVTLVDQNEKLLAKAKSGMGYRYNRTMSKTYADDLQKAKSAVHEMLQRVHLSTELEEACAAGPDLLVEAIIEDIDVKKKLFGILDKVSPEKTVFASNTSSLSVSQMASVTSRQDRFVGLHFFSPVPVMQLVEVVRLDLTSDQTFKTATDFVATIGKIPVRCKDTPGFVVNRLLIPYILEAIRMYERGDASANDIDTAMKLGAGYKIGPLELADFVGLDVCHLIIQGWSKHMPDNPLFRPVPMVEQMVKEGRLGRKSGRGFYEYNDHGAAAKQSMAF